MAARRRRSPGEGGISQRANGRFQVSYYDADGHRRTLQAATRAEAAEKLAEAQRHARQTGSRQPLGDYLADWLPETDVKPITHRRYESLIRLHTGPVRDIALRDLRPADLTSLYRGLQDAGQSSASIAQLHAVLHSALDHALQDELIDRNPAAAARHPKVRHRQAHFPTMAEVHALLEAAHGDWYEHLYALAIHTGARQGELLALRWTDIDLDGGTIDINATLVRLDHDWVRATPKTETSRRTVPLNAAALRALRDQRHKVTPLLQAVHELPAGDTFVFLSPHGEPVNGFHLTERHFKPMLRRAGLPAMTFHSLRHVAATLMLKNGVPVHVASRILGHASPSVTFNVYAHALQDEMKPAVDAIEQAITRDAG